MRRKDRQVTDLHDIRQIIKSIEVCRMAMVDTSGPVPEPYIVALNFGYEESGGPEGLGTFWFHCAPAGRKLDILKVNPRVCLQIDTDHMPIMGDQACDWGMRFASVIAAGQAVLVQTDAERQHGLDILMSHHIRLWAGPDNRLPDAGHPGMPSGGHPGIPATRPEGGFAYDPKVLAATTVLKVEVETLSAKRKV